MLYFTGGLVLGETIALWMTVRRELVLLAVMLPAFFLYRKFCETAAWKKLFIRSAPESGSRRRSVCFFALLFLLGCLSGIGRMEYEQYRFKSETDVLNNWKKGTEAEGEIREIAKTQSGYRLLLRDCTIDQGQYIRGLYCYVDSADGKKLGMKIRVKGEAAVPDPDRNPGSFSYQTYCFARGVSGIIYSNEEKIIDGNWLIVHEWARTARISLESQLEKIAVGDDIGLLKAILLGNKTEISDEVYEEYRKNGISHVLAISGLHVSVIGAGFWKILKRLGIGYELSGLAAFAGLFFYGAVVGFGTSVARAVFMMGISFLAGIFGRTYDLPSAASVPAIGLLLFHPYLLTQAAFQLSFLAVGAIFFPGEYLAKRWELKGAEKNVWTSAAIQIVTLPVVLYHSFETPVYSLFLNLAVVPLMTYVLISGLLGIAASFFSIPAGTAALGGAHDILWFYQWMCRKADGIPGGIFTPGRPEMTAVIAFYISMLLAVFLLGKKKKAGIAVFLAAVLFLFPVPQDGFTATFLDVGQGDGIVLQSESGTVLVDCGSSQKKNVGKDTLVPFLKSRGIRTLSAVIISHGDADHVSGIRYLLTEECGISIQAVVVPEIGSQDEALNELLMLAEKKDIPIFRKSAGDEMESYLGEQIQMRCLHPSVKEKNLFDRNEDSLVVELQYGKFRMILTGDLGIEGENEIMAREKLPEVTVLKAGHHGSASSTGENFLDVLHPGIVVFSYGRENRYGHPSEDVTERCRQLGADIYETGRSGAIKVRTDGERVRVSGWLDRRNKD